MSVAGCTGNIILPGWQQSVEQYPKKSVNTSYMYSDTVINFYQSLEAMN